MDTYTVDATGGVDAAKPKGERSSYQPETLDEIADKLGVDAEALFEANREVIGSNPDNLAIGMVLAVPEAPFQAGELEDAAERQAADDDDEGGAS